MATCKDCLHFEVCKFMYGEEFEQHWPPFGTCDRFKDSSRFVELPCKVGDHVFRLCGTKKTRYVAERIVSAVTLCGNGSWSILSTAYDALGKTVFLTREEAEAELARRTANG